MQRPGRVRLELQPLLYARGPRHETVVDSRPQLVAELEGNHQPYRPVFDEGVRLGRARVAAGQRCAVPFDTKLLRAVGSAPGVAGSSVDEFAQTEAVLQVESNCQSNAAVPDRPCCIALLRYERIVEPAKVVRHL